MSETNPNDLDADRLNDMLRKIRALLAKAEAAGTTAAERDSYNEKAAELTARYGIDAALLGVRSPGADEITDRWIRLHAPYITDKRALLNAIATALRSEVVFHPSEPIGHLFGYETDLRRVEILYASLEVQADQGVRKALPPAGQDVKMFRRTWLLGFAGAVLFRLRNAETAAQTETEAAPDGSGSSLAVVLADRSSRVAAAVATAYPNTRRSEPRTTGPGVGAGFGAGMKANLGGVSN